MTQIGLRLLFTMELLARSKEGEVKLEDLALSLQAPPSLIEKWLCDLKTKGFMELRGPEGSWIVVDKLGLALEAISLGASPESVSRWLHWRDFEKLCLKVFELNGFRTILSFRFKAIGHLHEVDVLAIKYPLLLAIDCKSWGIRSGKPSMLREAVKRQVKRVEALTSTLPGLKKRLGLEDGARIILTAVIVTLFEESLKIYAGIPIVPISKLNNFIQEIHAYLDSLSTWRMEL